MQNANTINTWRQLSVCACVLACFSLTHTHTYTPAHLVRCVCVCVCVYLCKCRHCSCSCCARSSSPCLSLPLLLPHGMCVCVYIGQRHFGNYKHQPAVTSLCAAFIAFCQSASSATYLRARLTLAARIRCPTSGSAATAADSASAAAAAIA